MTKQNKTLAIAATMSTLIVLGPLKWLQSRLAPGGSEFADHDWGHHRDNGSSSTRD